MNTKNCAELVDLSKMKRNDVVPYYVDMILKRSTHGEIIRINNLIIDRWSAAALIYIKEAAWKQVNTRTPQ